MRGTGLGLLVAAMTLTGCAAVRDSRVNPFNWFGPSAPVEAAAPSEGRNALIPARRASFLRGDGVEVYGGVPVATIETLAIERRPGGAILRATGLAATPGPFEVRLTEEPGTEPGTRTYALRALASPGPRASGPNAARVTAAVFLSDQELAGVSELRVLARDGGRSVRR